MISAMRVPGPADVHVSAIPLCIILGVLAGCTTLQPTASTEANEHGQRAACQTRYSQAVSAVAGLCVAASQAAGAAITGDLSHGGAAVLTLGTVVMPDRRPICD